MSERLRLIVGALVVVMMPLISFAPAGAQLSDDITVSVDPRSHSVVLGESFDIRVSVTNNSEQATPPLVVHIDITKADQETSVDPEDWTPTLSKPIGGVAPGETTVVDWAIQPISAGTFVTYAVALSPGIDNIAASNVLEVRVDDQRSLNPGGIIPVAIGAPALIGALLLLQMRLSRRVQGPSGLGKQTKPPQPAAQRLDR